MCVCINININKEFDLELSSLPTRIQWNDIAGKLDTAELICLDFLKVYVYIYISWCKQKRSTQAEKVNMFSRKQRIASESNIAMDKSPMLHIYRYVSYQDTI